MYSGPPSLLLHPLGWQRMYSGPPSFLLHPLGWQRMYSGPPSLPFHSLSLLWWSLLNRWVVCRELWVNTAFCNRLQIKSRHCKVTSVAMVIQQVTPFINPKVNQTPSHSNPKLPRSLFYNDNSASLQNQNTPE